MNRYRITMLDFDNRTEDGRPTVVEVAASEPGKNAQEALFEVVRRKAPGEQNHFHATARNAIGGLGLPTLTAHKL